MGQHRPQLMVRDLLGLAAALPLPIPMLLSPKKPNRQAYAQVGIHTGIIRAELAKRILFTTCSCLFFLLTGCSIPTEVVTEEPTVPFTPYSPSTPTPSPVIILPTITAVPTVGPTATPFMHIVEKDDTLLGIAIRYGVSLDDLLAANPGINPTILSIDQKIIIPGPEGDSSSTFLPEVTPVPLTLSEVKCFPTPTNTLLCISTLTNNEGYPLEGVSVLLSLLDESGILIDSKVSFSPITRIPQDSVVPLSATFRIPAEGYTFVVAVPISGYPAVSVEDRYLTYELDLELSEPTADGKSWRLSGKLISQHEDGSVANRITIMAMAFDTEGFIIGFRKVELSPEEDTGEGIPFDFEVFSLGPAIDHTEILIEAIRSVEVE